MHETSFLSNQIFLPTRSYYVSTYCLRSLRLLLIHSVKGKKLSYPSGDRLIALIKLGKRKENMESLYSFHIFESRKPAA